MSSINHRKISVIANYYGIESQMVKTVEELSELTASIARLSGNLDDKQLHDDMVSEMADVEIMLAQLKYLLDIDTSTAVEFKISRQLDRMDIESQAGSRCM